jgi:uncharacterized protein with GYD domain
LPVFLLEVTYTSEAWTEMITHPQDRAQAVRDAVAGLGGKVGSFWTSLGEYDLVGIISMPDILSAAAFAMAISAGGACKAVKTTPLLTMNEGVEAMAKARTCGYQPVGNKAYPDEPSAPQGNKPRPTNRRQR